MAGIVALGVLGICLGGNAAEGNAGVQIALLAAALVLGEYLASSETAHDRSLDSAVAALALLAAGLWDGTGLIRVGSLALNSAELACPLLAVTLAGVPTAMGKDRERLLYALSAAAVALVLMGSFAVLGVLVLVAATLFVLHAKHRVWALVATTACCLAWAAGTCSGAEPELTMWLNTPRDLYGSGWQLSLFLKTLAEATPLGAGQVSTLAASIPDASTYALARCVSAFGWVGLALVTVCTLSVIASGVRAVLSRTHAEKDQALAVTVCFASFALVNVAYVFHLVPVPTLPFPLLSADGIGLAVAGVLVASWTRAARQSLIPGTASDVTD